MKRFLKNYINKLPYIKGLVSEVSRYKTANPPGHFYSPVVSVDEIRENEGELFSIRSKSILGIELNEDEQLELLHNLHSNYLSIPFGDEKRDGLRYYYKNEFYCHSDAIFLHLIIRKFRPKSIIEIGSGFSSAVMLDTNELFLDNSVNVTFIEPYPDRLLSLLNEKDKKTCKIINTTLQKVELAVFERLEANDILFVDSTHVSKTNSDVNRLLFEILPRLKKGVLIHFHDIFFPFEYPKEWVLNWKGFGWNENYILKAFLMYNDDFKIVMFNTFLEHFHRDWFRENMPDCLKNEGGSIWLQKL